MNNKPKNTEPMGEINWEAYLENIILEYEWFRRIPAHILSKRLKVPYDEIKKGIWMGKFEAEIKRISYKLEAVIAKVNSWNILGS